MSLFGNIIKLISRPVGNNLTNAPDDVEALKRNFSYEGRYEKPVANGYIDSELNRAIYSFQRDHSLQVDGRVNPGGETEATLAGRILGFDQPQNSGIIKASAPLAVPTLMLAVASALGMSTAGAWEWWQNQPTPVRQGMLNALSEQGDTERDEECDRIDRKNRDRCNDITSKWGPRAGRACHESASEIFAACRKGTPVEQWPPLAD